MIKVDRSLVSLSTSATRALKAAHAKVREFYLNDHTRSQKRFSFMSDPWHMTRPTLRELFDNTCAYCETPSEMVDLTIEHFRPISEASDLQGVSDPDWYWWLAYKWENLYLACSECIQHKNNLFPVEGARLPKEKLVGPKTRENYLLIDPCIDDPIEFLRFTEDGLVHPISEMKGTSSNPSARGGTTIGVLGLNRSQLVQRRKDVADRILKQLAGFPRYVREYSVERSKILAETLDELVDEFSSFVALKRHIAARFVIANASVYRMLSARHNNTIRRVEKAIKRYVDLERKFPQARDAGPEVSTVKDEVTITYDNAYIERIEIKNFRNIHELDIKLKTDLTDAEARTSPAADPSADPTINLRAGWKMLLGENGFGKSSVLKAVALALMGEDYYRAYAKTNRLEPPRIFNRKAETKSGLIRITLSKGEPIEVRFTRTRLNFRSGANAAKGVFVRAYGSARLFAPEGGEGMGNMVDEPSHVDSPPIQQVENLFHPEMLLSHPATWLKANLDILDSTALSFRDLLNLPNHVDLPLTEEDEEILLDTGNGPVPLAEQSDGYKTVLAFVLDILAGLPKSLRDKRTATGIVLIDELDSHLHPRWKMRIVRSLRQTFPRLQFLATTHEPLCLRGLGKDEIAVMKKTADVLEVIDDVPSPEDLRVDQLLTSEFFGLESTIDPIVDEKFYNYYQFLANSTETSNALSKKEREKQAYELGRQLEKYNTLGFTRRDRMVYRLIDEYLANKDKLSKPKQEKFTEDTKKRVFELWDLIGLRNG